MVMVTFCDASGRRADRAHADRNAPAQQRHGPSQRAGIVAKHQHHRHHQRKDAGGLRNRLADQHGLEQLVAHGRLARHARRHLGRGVAFADAAADGAKAHGNGRA